MVHWEAMRVPRLGLARNNVALSSIIKEVDMPFSSPLEEYRYLLTLTYKPQKRLMHVTGQIFEYAEKLSELLRNAETEVIRLTEKINQLEEELREAGNAQTD